LSDDAWIPDKADGIAELPVITVRNKPSIDKLQSIIKDRPYALQTIQLQIIYDMASILESTHDRIVRLEEQFSSTIPKGRFVAREYTVVADKPVEIKREDEKTLPWMSFTLFNDGKGEIYVQINERIARTKASLVMGDSIDVDMKSPKIERVYLSCPSGTATVRIYAKK
jgi:hypothetical protein